MRILENKEGQQFIQLSNGKVYDFNGKHKHSLAAKKLAAKVVKSDHAVPVFFRYYNSLECNKDGYINNTEEAIVHNSYRNNCRTRDSKLKYINQYFNILALTRKSKNSKMQFDLLQKILIDNIDRVEIVEDGSGVSCDLNFFIDRIESEISVINKFTISWMNNYHKSEEEAYEFWYDNLFKSAYGTYESAVSDSIPGLNYKELFMYFKKFYEDHNYVDFCSWNLIEAVLWILSHVDKIIIHNFMALDHDDNIIPIEHRKQIQLEREIIYGSKLEEPTPILIFR